MFETSAPLIQFQVPGLILPTVTKSIGLLADARFVMVFAAPLRQFYRDTKLLHLNRDWQKPMPTATQTATNQTAGPLAAIFHGDNVMTFILKY